VKINLEKIKNIYKPSQKGQLSLFDDIDSILENSQFISLDNPSENKELLAYWWMKVYIPNRNNGFDIYKSWHNAFNIFKYLYQSGYIADTNQSCIKLMCTKSASTQDHIDELNYFLDYIIPSNTHNGESKNKAKNISIFENTLSEHGCYSLHIYNDNHIEY
jgi:hypothetical protein